ncbi:hypothetical protein FQN57_002779 [Myotisia sp. PD_48]|nr:hypothetical protein FQN57_002779 [Myotisia sp. PD_48]
MDPNRGNEQVYASSAQSTPTDTPFRSPTEDQHSLRLESSPLEPSPSPLAFDRNAPFGHEPRGNTLDFLHDNTISPLDPRRFTPTLHASLVSEILSLRRDLEGKVKIIENLELNLDHSRAEVDSLQESLAKNAKESRILNKQLQLLEGGSLSAVTELTKERDEAWESITEVRKRLEESQRKAKSHEEQVDRTQDMWDHDRQKWEEDRRKLETKVHIVEGRLKVVLQEISLSQLNGARIASPELQRDELCPDDHDPASNGVGASNRMSTASMSTYDGDHNNNYRYSTMTIPNGLKCEGSNLADELAFDEEDEEEEEEGEATEICSGTYINSDIPGDDDFDELDASREGRPMSAHSILSLSKQNKTKNRTSRKVVSRELESMRLESDPIQYRDVGIQFTPPPSPGLSQYNRHSFSSTQGSVLSCTKDAETSTIDLRAKETVASKICECVDRGVGTIQVEMVSTPCQTIESQPLNLSLNESKPQPEPITLIAASTQTKDEGLEPVDTPYFTIPKITIQPPGSKTSSPRTSVVLPPQTKNASSQTVPLQRELCSSGMQTEEIRVDKRAPKIKASLLPSALEDLALEPATTNGVKDPRNGINGVDPRHPLSLRTSNRRQRRPPPVDILVRSKISQAYPGNNDNGPLDEETESGIRRPFRSSSLFAGFDPSDEETAHLPEDVFTDEDILSRPMASYTLRLGKLVTKPSHGILDDSPLEKLEDELSSKLANRPPQLANTKLQRSMARGKSSKRPSRSTATKTGPSKQPDIRRAAMISSSAAAHQARPRSPSAPSIGSTGSGGTQPPFPVPTRLSSRKMPSSTSDGAQSPTPFSNGTFPRHSGRELPLRKIRSAAAVSKHRREGRTVSHSTLSMSSGGPESPQRPPMPFDEITAPGKKRSAPRQPHHQQPPKPQEPPHQRQDSIAATVQQTSVVDAIAQTMIGEWMWKYVRRRKSFGVSEAPRDGWEGKSTDEVSANISGSGVRHKRWVWLAPYERAVMWSSKQPTNGTALLGKSGRKLIIQSVLDVKDDNPLPKGAVPQNGFNRSILILTPQRALKFTALTLERHYVWLTALSFLSHSLTGLDDLARLPPVPQVEYNQRPPTASLRRNPIRDSIRVAKGKHRPTIGAGRSVTAHPPAVPEFPFPDVSNNAGSQIESADPPNIPRFSSHTRKRSNTAPKPSQNPFRSFSNHVAAPSTYSSTTAGSSELYSPTSVVHSGVLSGQSSFSRRTSVASGHTHTTGNANFFDAIGTVRMEAFVERAEIPRPRGGGYRNYHSKKKDYWPQSPSIESHESADIFLRNYDPFKGF